MVILWLFVVAFSYWADDYGLLFLLQLSKQIQYSILLILLFKILSLFKVLTGIFHQINFIMIFERVNNMIKVSTLTKQILCQYNNGTKMINLWLLKLWWQPSLILIQRILLWCHKPGLCTENKMGNWQVDGFEMFLYCSNLLIKINPIILFI